jgi:acetate---CoA ligase (ADP-forming)
MTAGRPALHRGAPADQAAAARQQGSTPGRTALHAMLEARTVALVGASPRAGSFGARMIAEVAASGSRPGAYLVNPKYRQIGGLRCYGSLAELPEPVDLVLLGVPDPVLADQLALAAGRGDRSAVIFGNAHAQPRPGEPTLRQRLAALASGAGMELCGAGCMGFANVSYGLRAMGYREPDPLPAGPVALVTHSGSVFSALLRARRAIGFTLAVSSGQELVTTTPSYLQYALGLPDTQVLALVLEAIRDGSELKRALATAADRDIPVVLLTAGSSATGRALVTAHSGALAAADGGWEALCRAYGVHRVGNLAELADTIELFAVRAPRPGLRAGRGPGTGPAGAGIATVPAGAGIATVHDSGLERAHVADLADQLGVRFAAISETTRAKLAEVLEPGLEPANPLDVWGTGNQTRELFGAALAALADDPAVGAVALAVDLVPELDGDRGYPLAVTDAAGRTGKPVVVLSNLASALDRAEAEWLRGAGIAVLEGTSSGLRALQHLLDRQAAQASRAEAEPPAAGQPGGTAAAPWASDRGRRARALLASGPDATALLQLLGWYGLVTPAVAAVTDCAAAIAAAERIGYPIVLKTAEPAIAHKSDAGGVIPSIGDDAALAAAYADLAARLGPAALVCEQVPAGIELALGIVRDAGLGPLVVVGAGGILVELLADRAVALPPVSRSQALDLLSGLRVRPLLAGARGGSPADLDAIAAAVSGMADLAAEAGDELDALDVNPLICGPAGAIAVDALLVPRDGGRA